MKKYITQLGVIFLLTAVLFGASSASVLAQHAHPQKDPFKNPQLWAQIEQSPHNKSLWVEYMGKNWDELSYTERLKIKMWIQDLWLQQLSNQNAVVVVVIDENQNKPKEVKVVDESTYVKTTKVTKPKEVKVVDESTYVKTTKVTKPKEVKVVDESTYVKTTKVTKPKEVKVVDESTYVKTTKITKPKEVKVEEVKVVKVEPVKRTIVNKTTQNRTAHTQVALTTDKLTRQSLAFEVAEKDPVYKKVLEKPKVRVFIKDLTEVVLAEPMDMMELKDDLFGNFLIIEDYYRESFDEYGIKYVFYAEKYPLGGYSEARWVNKHDQQLKALKAKRLNTLKRKFLDKQLTASVTGG